MEVIELVELSGDSEKQHVCRPCRSGGDGSRAGAHIGARGERLGSAAPFF